MLSIPTTTSLAAPVAYRRREPEHSLLYALVAAEAQGARDAVAAASPHGRGLPRHVDKELTAFLGCGQLSRGFSRLRCRLCRTEHLVALSCKNRGICPSCTARRMHDTAAHLVARVLPHARYRQWVVTFSRRVRALLAADPKLASAALTEVLRTIFAWQKKRARTVGLRPARARAHGAVTFVQRFNSALELSLHFHILVPDGVFVTDDNAPPDARPRLRPIDEPTQGEVESLLDVIIERVTRMLRKRGHLDDGAPEVDVEPHLALALSPPGGARNNTAFVDEPLPHLCARKDGFSLHAATAVPPNDRQGLEHLCRYGLRPPLSQGRLSRAADGTIEYQMKRRFSDGRFLLRFEPQELLLRLCALIPPPKFHMVRYHGVIAPHARGRHALTGRGMRDNPAAPSTKPASKAPAKDPPASPPPTETPGPDNPTSARRLHWAALLKHSFGLDVLTCARCGSRMELISTITDRTVARVILTHLRLPTGPPPRPPPWRRQQPLPMGPLAPVSPDPFVDPPSMWN